MTTDTDAAMLSPSLLRRLAAMLYDTFLVVALVAVVNGFALGLVAWATSGAQRLLDPWIVQLLTVLSIAGFFCVFWLQRGQTLGMQAWRIKLVGFDGAPPTIGKALVRCCGAALSAACLGLGYLWCLVDRKQRYWHDYLSRTELVLLPRTGGDTAD
ncbi:MAG: RDD family protein [Halioglobus sp.]